MKNYYFIISSLPHLRYDMDNFPGLEDFFEICKSSMNNKHFEILESAKIFEIKLEHVPNELLKKWYSWELNLRNQLAVLRAQKKNEDPSRYIKVDIDQLNIEETALEAFEAESPLIGENILNKARWSYLEDLEFGHYFDFNKLIIYYLKLQILLRRKTFDKETGTQKLNEIIEDFSDLDIHEIKKNFQGY